MRVGIISSMLLHTVRRVCVLVLQNIGGALLLLLLLLLCLCGFGAIQPATFIATSMTIVFFAQTLEFMAFDVAWMQLDDTPVAEQQRVYEGFMDAMELCNASGLFAAHPVTRGTHMHCSSFDPCVRACVRACVRTSSASACACLLLHAWEVPSTHDYDLVLRRYQSTHQRPTNKTSNQATVTSG